MTALEAERAYAAAGVAGTAPRVDDLAAAGAVASRYLAVGTPRSLAIIGDGAASLAAHRTWFSPADVRCTLPAVAQVTGGRIVPVAEALAADIVCIHEPLAIGEGQLRRGTHVNALAAVTLANVPARVVDHTALAQIAAGFVDGRELDEITMFRATLVP